MSYTCIVLLILNTKFLRGESHMKLLKLLLIFLDFTEIAGAREYDQKRVNCRIYGTEQDVYNGERELPFDLNAEYIFGLDKNTREVLAVRGMSRPRINATSQLNQEELDQLINKLGFDNNIGKISLSSEDVKKLLTYFGDYRALFNEHELPAVEGRLEIGKTRMRLQSHLSSDTDYGLSYHIVISCQELGRRGNQHRRPQPRPNPPRNCQNGEVQCPTYVLVTGWYPCPVWYNSNKQCYGPHYRQVFNNPTSRDRY